MINTNQTLRFFLLLHPLFSISVSLSLFSKLRTLICEDIMAEAKKFSASDVLLHTTRDDCWLLIRGKVYDVTKFLDDHPGGEEVILQASASGDATDAFETVGHSSSAETMMEGYLIGSVDGYVAPNMAAESASRDSSSVKTNQPAVPPTSSFNPLPLLVIVLAVAAWYYFTVLSKNKE
ncbi:Cytochrome b5 [Rhynchospora pubera]|uniref:Cytochrome b5 n=1 Tax=Rhynchospora pubera TaxID=906938 RepID=A0AAV8C836_9POAL|nr:Cytochrome b5 [Rhynchospora pubera]